MTDLILHHYPPSLFSEKIRALFGYLRLEWQSTIISSVMPRPALMPLSGGYRKTPILQHGANVFCDTAIIARHLAALADDDTLYAQGFVATRLAEWADTTLFQLAVAVCFQPRAAAGFASQMSAEELARFAEDRAQLSPDAQLGRLDAAVAEASFAHYMRELEVRLSTPFLFGGVPSIADFALYHPLWFVRNNAAVAPLVSGSRNVDGWFERMRSFTSEPSGSLTPEAALAVGAAATPQLCAYGEPLWPEGLQAGAVVDVTPSDYGKIPVTGELLHCSDEAIAVRRTDAEAGEVIVYFPRVGFEVVAAK